MIGLKGFTSRKIVLPLGFANVIFQRERSDDRKYVCCSRARLGIMLYVINDPKSNKVLNVITFCPKCHGRR